MEQASQATREEILAYRRRCWRPYCPNKAWIEDWSGWHWCLKDFLWSSRDHASEDWTRWFFLVRKARFYKCRI